MQRGLSGLDPGTERSWKLVTSRPGLHVSCFSAQYLIGIYLFLLTNGPGLREVWR